MSKHSQLALDSATEWLGSTINDVNVELLAEHMNDFATNAVSEAIGEIIKNGTYVQTVNSGEYSRGWCEAMRFVEGVAKAIRARGSNK